MYTKRSILGLVLALSACSSATGGDSRVYSPGGKADDSGADAVLAFDADFNEVLRGRITAGGTLEIRYDLARLPGCRGELNGGPAWTITGNYLVDGGAPATFEVMDVVDGEAVPAASVLTVPAGAEIAFYFTISNRWGCIEYDSDYGQNYRYAIEGGEPAGEATVSFEADGTVTTSGRVAAGGTLIVHYDPARLPDCRGTQAGYPAWNLFGNAAVDGGEAWTFEVTRVEGSDRAPSDPALSVPVGSDLALWFTVGNRWGCTATDDNGGARYHLPIE